MLRRISQGVKAAWKVLGAAGEDRDYDVWERAERAYVAKVAPEVQWDDYLLSRAEAATRSRMRRAIGRGQETSRREHAEWLESKAGGGA